MTVGRAPGAREVSLIFGGTDGVNKLVTTSTTIRDWILTATYVEVGDGRAYLPHMSGVKRMQAIVPAV